MVAIMFQSPRSGKFVSDENRHNEQINMSVLGFNPLDRGNLYQINITYDDSGAVEYMVSIP